MYLSVVLFASSLLIVQGIHESMNFALAPSKRECFYEEIGVDEYREVEVFVNSGGFLDITLHIYGPLTLDDVRAEKFESPIQFSEKIDAEKQSQSDSQTFKRMFKPTVEGTFAFCLDNRSAKFITKIVEIDVRPVDTNPVVVKKKAHHSSVKEAGEIESVERSRETIERIRQGLIHIQEQQQRDRHRLGLHAETNSINENRMIVGSIIETSIFIFAALFQLYFIRNWFASRGANAGGKPKV